MRARELDERVYRQEFRASFENLTSGGVYYAFERSDLQPLSYDPQFPLCWSLHFNIDPASACYVKSSTERCGYWRKSCSEKQVRTMHARNLHRRTKAWGESMEEYRLLSVFWSQPPKRRLAYRLGDCARVPGRPSPGLQHHISCESAKSGSEGQNRVCQ